MQSPMLQTNAFDNVNFHYQHKHEYTQKVIAKELISLYYDYGATLTNWLKKLAEVTCIQVN